jgi:polar amino acid transport system permease protein
VTSSEPAGAPEARPAGGVVTAVPVRHPGRWVAGAVVVLLAAMLVHTLGFSWTYRGGLHQTRYQWDVIGQYFATRPVLLGLEITLELTVLAMVIGIALGVLFAVMRLSPNPLVSSASWLYIWFFRGTPVLVQLFFWEFVSYLYPKLTLGVPFGPAFFHFSANSVITSFSAAVIALGLNEGAYMAEIVRAGLLSVDEGQTEAAHALGMTRGQTLRRIVLPQAMRVIIPPTGNETISMLKTSSLASVIGVGELLFSVELIYARTYQIVPLLMVACIWYLIVTTILSIGQYYVERHFAKGALRELPPTPYQRLRNRVAVFNLRQENTILQIDSLGRPGTGL